MAVPHAMSIMSHLQLSGRALRRLMQQLSRAEITVPGRNSLTRAMELTAHCFEDDFASAKSPLCLTNGSYVYCSNVARFACFVVYLSGYKNDDVKYVKINGDDGQQIYQVHSRLWYPATRYHSPQCYGLFEPVHRECTHDVSVCKENAIFIDNSSTTHTVTAS